jgi:hypothetical protein
MGRASAFNFPNKMSLAFFMPLHTPMALAPAMIIL